MKLHGATKSTTVKVLLRDGTRKARTVTLHELTGGYLVSWDGESIAVGTTPSDALRQAESILGNYEARIAPFFPGFDY